MRQLTTEPTRVLAPLDKQRHLLTEARVDQRVEKGIVHGRHFGEDTRNGGYQRAQGACITEFTDERNNRVRGPGNAVEHHSYDSSFGCLQFDIQIVLLLSPRPTKAFAARAMHSHSAAVPAEISLLVVHGLEDVPVAGDDDEQGSDETTEEHSKNEGPVGQ